MKSTLLEHYASIVLNNHVDSLPVTVAAIDVLKHQEQELFGAECEVKLHYVGVVAADQAHDLQEETHKCRQHS